MAKTVNLAENLAAKEIARTYETDLVHVGLANDGGLVLGFEVVLPRGTRFSTSSLPIEVELIVTEEGQ